MGVKILYVLTASVFALLHSEAGGLKDSSECQAWKNVTDFIKRTNFTCAVNEYCTGIQCSGDLSFGLVHESVQFGAAFLPCNNPLKFNVSIDLPNYHFNTMLNVSKNQTVRSTIQMPEFPKVTVEMNLTIFLSTSLSASGNLLITTEMNVTAKIKPLSLSNEYILIPRMTIPVPTCHNLVGEPLTSGNPLPSDFTGESCKWLDFEAGCKGKNQACLQNGRCVCKSGFFWSSDTKQCVDSSSTPTTPTASGSSNKIDVWIIVAATISAVVLLAGILIAVVHKYKRNRERYGQHTLLVNSENDTELDDPDPPMLAG